MSDIKKEGEDINGIFAGISDEPDIQPEYANKVSLEVDHMGVPVFKFYYLDTDFEEDDMALPKRVIAVAPYVLLELQDMIQEATEDLERHISELEDMMNPEQPEEELQN